MVNQGNLVPEACVVLMDRKDLVGRKEGKEIGGGRENRERSVLVDFQV